MARRKSKKTFRRYYFIVLIILFCIAAGTLFLILREAPILTKKTTSTQQQFSKLLLSGERRRQKLKLPILLYHYVEIVTDDRDTIRKSLALSPRLFEEQVMTLLRFGYTPIVPRDLTPYFAGEGDLPKLPVILSFDDGYRDFYTDVFPILQKYQVKAVLYMVSGFLDSTKNYLTKAQLKEVAASGLVEIGAHSVSHAHLPLLQFNLLVFEIRGSKRVLENLLGTPVTSFAYPNGAYSPQVVSEVENEGFTSAVTVDKGTDQSWAERYTMTRIRPGANVGEDLARLLRN